MSKGVALSDIPILEALQYAKNYAYGKEQQTHDMYSKYQKGKTQRRVKNSRSSDQVLKSKRRSDLSDVDPSKSAHDKDDPFRRAPIIGQGAMINNRNQNKKLRLTCGPRIMTNNLPVLSQILNASTRVSVQKGFLYKAEEGVRTFHFQHFRHSAHASTKTNSPIQPTAYAAVENIHVMMPQSYANTTPSYNSPFEPVETDVSNASQRVHGSGSQYSPYSLVDLENISWNLQHGKAFYPQMSQYHRTGFLGTSGLVEDSAADSVSSVFASDTYMKQIYGPRFAPKGYMYLNNYLRSRWARRFINDAVGNYAEGEKAVDFWNDAPGFKGKVVLKGGRVHYQFTNVEAMPAVINIIVYKTRKDLDHAALSGETNPATYDATDANGNPISVAVAESTPYPFDNGYLQKEHCKVVAGSYLDKLKTISLKTFQGTPRVASEATTDAKYQFLPKLRPKNGNKSVMVEQQRISFCLAGGETRDIDINLPGELYDPTSSVVGDTDGEPLDIAAVGFNTGVDQGSAGEAGEHPEYNPTSIPAFYDDKNILSLASRTKQWNNMQYSIAIGVSGADALNRVVEGVDASIEGHTTSAANVQCRMQYTEDIGAMHMSVKRVTEQNTRGRIGEVYPTGNAQSHAATIIPLEDTIRVAGGQVFETHEDEKTNLQDGS